MSKIEWTDRTWNPVTGCTKVSPGCDNCYAEAIANRFHGGFDLRLHPDRMHHPRKWGKPCMVFVNSMSDMFHKDIPRKFKDEVFDVMEDCDRHTYQILTKRSSLMMHYINKRYGPNGACPEHIWLGVSVESRGQMVRIKHLLNTNAHVRFLSLEPLLGKLDPLDLDGIKWVIAGGESGPKHRPIEADWVRDIRDQCVASGTAFFFKQWGGRTPKAGGDELDGRQWHEYPPDPTPQTDDQLDLFGEAA